MTTGSVRSVRLVDLFVAAMIFCVATWGGLRAVQAFRGAGGVASFYQSEFAPAVMFACGHGLRNPDARTATALDPFLSQAVDEVRCAALRTTAATEDLDAFQRTARYLELTVGWVWWMTGVSWSKLALLNGVLFGTVAALTFGIYRLALTRTLALIGMVPILMSTPNLDVVPHLRDYAKGPFLLAVIVIMGALVVQRRTPRAVIAMCAAAGVVVGVGLGFRTDLMIAVPPFVVVAAGLVPAASLRLRAAAVAAFLIAFGAAAFPLLSEYSRGNNIGPVALLGLAKPFDAALRVDPSVYEFGAQYNDSLAFSIVNSYAVRVEGLTGGVDLASPEHAAASIKYVGEIARTFPADLVTRTLAACRTTTRYFLDSALEPPAWVRSGPLRTAYWLRGAVSSRLAPLAVPALVLATAIVSLAQPRAAWLIVIAMVAFAGGAAIQFHERHFFYLQFIPWLAFGIVAQTAFRGVAAVRDAKLEFKSAALFAAIVVLAVAGVLGLSRAFQQRSASALFARYEAAPRTPLSLVETPAGAGTVRLSTTAWNSPLPAGTPRVATQFLGVRFHDRSCGIGGLPITLRYQATLPELDFSEPLTVALVGQGNSSTTLFFPAYDRPGDSTRFRGIELAKAQAGCIDSVFSVTGVDHEPLLLTTVLPADWRSLPLHQLVR